MPRLPQTRQAAVLALASAALAGCLTTTPPASGRDAGQPTAGAAKVEPCEAIATLTKSYGNQFADLRRAKRSYNRIDIWSTSYQIVGNNCEIWGWQGGHFNYVCNYVAPDEQSARDIYDRARNTIRQCLAAEWSLRETTLPDAQDAAAQGSQAVFKKADFSGVIDLRLLQTRGINTPRWAVYVMIGDYNAQL